MYSVYPDVGIFGVVKSMKCTQWRHTSTIQHAISPQNPVTVERNTYQQHLYGVYVQDTGVFKRQMNHNNTYLSVYSIMAPSVVTTTGGDEYVLRVAEVIAAAFSNSIFTAYLHRTPESAWPSSQIPIEILKPYFEKNIALRVLHGAELAEAGNWAAVAVW